MVSVLAPNSSHELLMDADGSRQDESASKAADQVTPDQEVDPCPVRLPNPKAHDPL